MLRRIGRLLPHAMILICNMYIAFFLIDLVNPAMNFIDNGLTKLLLLALGLMTLYSAVRMMSKPPKNSWLPRAFAVPGAIMLLLLLADVLWPRADLFLDRIVKNVLLIAGLSSSLFGMWMISRRRRWERDVRRRWERPARRAHRATSDLL